MKLVTAFHHAENWYFFPVWDKRYDCGDPRYSGLYGPIHEKGAQPTKESLDRWEGKIKEVIDKYEPDCVWFDFGLPPAFDALRPIAGLLVTNYTLTIWVKDFLPSMQIHTDPYAFRSTPHLGRRTTIWISDAPRYIKRSRVKQSNGCLL